MIFLCVWDFRSTASNLMNKSLIYLCECVWVLFFAVCLCETRNLFPLAEIKCKQIEKLFFFVCSYWLNCVFVFYFVWIIYYYYYSIINSEIKKEVCRRKKKTSEKEDFRFAFLFCFVLLDFCCRKSREPKLCWILK